MGLFKRTTHKSSDNDSEFLIFTPTIHKLGDNIFEVKGKSKGFVEEIKSKRRR